MLIHIIRHTKPEIEPGICYGQADLSLADTFEAESQQVLAKLLDHYDAVYSSPLNRCIKLSNKLVTPYRHCDQRLMEYDFGDWELTPWNDLRSSEAQRWMDNFVEQSAPNGESLLTMQTRVSSFWNELLSFSHKTVAVVTHAGVQRLIHGDILKTPIDHIFRLQLDFGSIIEVNSDEKSGLVSVKHL